MFDNILMVCVGNICRSPSAEKILQNLLPHKKISSAGLNAMVGHEIEQTAAKLLQQHDVTGLSHKARQINAQLVADAELILVMEKQHQQLLMHKYPSASGKVMLLGKWNNDEDIPDPYKKSNEAFEHVYKLINSNCDSWAKKLK